MSFESHSQVYLVEHFSFVDVSSYADQLSVNSSIIIVLAVIGSNNSPTRKKRVIANDITMTSTITTIMPNLALSVALTSGVFMCEVASVLVLDSDVVSRFSAVPNKYSYIERFERKFSMLIKSYCSFRRTLFFFFLILKKKRDHF